MKTSKIATILAVLRPSGRKLAKRLSIDLSHLSAMRRGHSMVGNETADKFYKEFGIRPEWLINGEAPIFKKGKSPGQDVEDAIERQLQSDLPSPNTVPLYAKLQDVNFEEGDGDWHRSLMRGLVPITGLAGAGRYVAGDDPSIGKIFGCGKNEAVLLVQAKSYMRKTRVSEGDQIPCIVEHRGKKLAAKYEIACILGKDKELSRRDMRKVKPVATFVLADGTRFLLSQLAPADRLKNVTLLAVAIRSERDLIVRSPDTTSSANREAGKE